MMVMLSQHWAHVRVQSEIFLIHAEHSQRDLITKTNGLTAQTRSIIIANATVRLTDLRCIRELARESRHAFSVLNWTTGKV